MGARVTQTVTVTVPTVRVHILRVTVLLLLLKELLMQKDLDVVRQLRR